MTESKLENQNSKKSEWISTNDEKPLLFSTNIKSSIFIIENGVRNIDGTINLSELTKFLKEEKVELLNFSEISVDGRIDISKLVNSRNDHMVDLFKFTTNIVDDQIDLARIIDGTSAKIHISRLSGVIDFNGILDLGKITDSSNSGIIDLNKIDYTFTAGDPPRLLLSSFTNSRCKGKLDLFKIQYCLSHGKIDLSKIRNNEFDSNIDFFKYTINHIENRIILANLTDSGENKIDIFKLNGVTDENGLVDFSKIRDSDKIDLLDYSNIKLEKLLHKNKLCLSKIKAGWNGQKMDLFDFPKFLYNRKIDISKICNSESDEEIDLVKWTINHKDGKIDISILTDSSLTRIDLYKLSGIINNFGVLDLGKIYDYSNRGNIDISKINIKCFYGNPRKLLLSSFTDSLNSGKIDLFKIPWCINNKKIDLSKICNSYGDEKIDLVKFTTNHNDGRIDLSKLMNSASEKIDVYNLVGLVDIMEILDLAKIQDTSNNNQIDLLRTNFRFTSGNPPKLLLSSFTDSSRDGKFDLFQIKWCIYNEKIDISKICNSKEDSKIDLFKYTNNHSDGRIDLALLVDSSKGILLLNELVGVVDDLGVVDFSKIFDSSNEGKINYNKFKIDKLYLSDLKRARKGENIDLYNFSQCVINGKIDLANLSNSRDDCNIDLFKYTSNHKDGRIDINHFFNSQENIIDLFQLSGIVDEYGAIDISKIYDSSNNGQIDFSKIKLDNLCHNGKYCLSKLKDSRNFGKINLLDFPPCLVDGKIDISKICNSKDDDNIDLFLYTTNPMDGRINISTLVDSHKNKIDLFKLTGVVNQQNVIDLAKVFDSTNKGKINFNTIKLTKIFKQEKLCLSGVKDSSVGGVIDLYDFPQCIINGKIDLNKICNSFEDDNIDLFKYTNNYKDDCIDLNYFNYDSENKIDLFKLNGIVDEHGVIDLCKIYDSSNNGQVDYRKIKLDNLCHNGKYCLSKIKDSKNGRKINLYEFSQFLLDGKIDLSKICNSNEDDSIDLFKYSKISKDGRIDLSNLINGDNTKINLFKLTGVVDCNGIIDIGRVYDSRSPDKIDYSKCKMDQLFNEDKLILSKITDTRNGGKINIFNFPQCLLNGKINISKLCNTMDDKNIDLFKYSSNIKDNKIDLSILVDSLEPKLDLFKLDGLADKVGGMDLSRVINDNSIDKFDYNKIKLDKFLCKGKLCLTKFKGNKNEGKIDLYDFPQCILDGRIDISKICNSENDDGVDLFNHTINLHDGLIDLAFITDTTSDRIDVLKLTGLVDKEGVLDLGKLTDSSYYGKINFQKIKFKCFNLNSGKLHLSRFTDSRLGGKFDIYRLEECISKGKIDISKFENSFCDEKIDLFKYTNNLCNGRIDLSMLIDTTFDIINIYKFSELVDENKILDIGKITDSQNNMKININKTNFVCWDTKFQQINIALFKDSSRGGKVNLFDLINCLTNGKIDITKIFNNGVGKKIDILKYTIHHDRNKIMIDLFRNGNRKYIRLNSFEGYPEWNNFVDTSGAGYFYNDFLWLPKLRYFSYDY